MIARDLSLILLLRAAFQKPIDSPCLVEKHHPPALSLALPAQLCLGKDLPAPSNMSDDDYSHIYDTIQKGSKDEGPDQLEENDGSLYDRVHENLGSESHLCATRLENQEYASVSAYALKREDATSASSEPEAESYLLQDEVFSEPQEVRDISTGDTHSPSQDPEHLPWERQGSGRMMEEDVPHVSSFTVQPSKGFSTSQDSPTCSVAAAIGLEGNKPASSSPEIFLFVKVRAASDRHTHTDRVKWSVFCFALWTMGRHLLS